MVKGMTQKFREEITEPFWGRESRKSGKTNKILHRSVRQEGKKKYIPQSSNRKCRGSRLGANQTIPGKKLYGKRTLKIKTRGKGITL